MPAYYNQRDDIADSLMAQKGASTFDYGLAGLGSAQQPMSMAGPPGMPAPIAGGVPGAGIGPAGTSIVPQQPQKLGMQGAMPAMPIMGGLGATPGMGGMPARKRQRGY